MPRSSRAFKKQQSQQLPNLLLLCSPYAKQPAESSLLSHGLDLQVKAKIVPALVANGLGISAQWHDAHPLISSQNTGGSMQSTMQLLHFGQNIVAWLDDRHNQRQ